MSKIKKKFLTKNLYVSAAAFIFLSFISFTCFTYVCAGSAAAAAPYNEEISQNPGETAAEAAAQIVAANAAQAAALNASDVSAPDNLYAKYAVLLDADTGRVLYGKNEETAAPMASTTKIMTCILALEYAPSDMKCVTSAYAASMPDVQLNAVCGEIFSLGDLLYSLMLKSHNDTAVIIAENVALNYLYNISSEDYGKTVPSLETLGLTLSDYSFVFDAKSESGSEGASNNMSGSDSGSSSAAGSSSGSEDNSHYILKNLSTDNSKMLVHLFACLMNEKARQLGCQNTYFITPNGLDAQDDTGVHSTTPKDLAVIMSYCIKNTDFLTVTQAKNHSLTSSKISDNGTVSSYKSYSVSNANAFLDMYDNIISGKTGFTGDAGYCYVCAYQCDGRTFVVSLLACGWPNNKSYKWKDAKKLLDYGRANYFPSTILDPDFKIDDVLIEDAIPDTLSLKTVSNEGFTALLSSSDKVNVSVRLKSGLSAPISENEQVGEVCVYINDDKFYSVPIAAANTIRKKTYFFYLKNIINDYLFLDK